MQHSTHPSATRRFAVGRSFLLLPESWLGRVIGDSGRRRGLLALAVCIGLLVRIPIAGAAFPHPDVAELTIAEAQGQMTSGRRTAESLVSAYLARIAAIDDAGPMLNAVISLNPDALKEARALDAERLAGKVRGPLHGIPILVKDNIDVKGLVTSAGSLALEDHRPAADAPVIARLRAAGVIVLGKTNLSEWANMRSTRSMSGWSSLGGQTRNPYALDRSPCGSSSGTGAAIAAGLAVAGLGTETDGSIMCPSSVNGIVGLKPSVGLLPDAGVVPISTSQDTVGPMARTVADAAALLTAMVPRPSARVTIDYARAARSRPLKKFRIGVVRAATTYHPAVERVIDAAIVRLSRGGASVADAAFPSFGAWHRAEMDVLLYEFGPALAHYFSETKAPVSSLKELIAFNRANEGRVMPWFGQDLFERAATKGPLTEPAYQEARKTARRMAGSDGIDAALASGPFDVLLTSAVGPAWTIDPLNGDHFLGAGYSAAAVAGYVSVTVPAGFEAGMPIGVVFMGPRWAEERVLAAAWAFEQATGARRPPTFLPTVVEPD